METLPAETFAILWFAFTVALLATPALARLFAWCAEQDTATVDGWSHPLGRATDSATPAPATWNYPPPLQGATLAGMAFLSGKDAAAIVAAHRNNRRAARTIERATATVARFDAIACQCGGPCRAATWKNWGCPTATQGAGDTVPYTPPLA